MNKIVIITLVVIIVIEGFFLVKNPRVEVEPFDDTELLLKIQKADGTATYWKEQSEYWQVIATENRLLIDSLENIKPQIQVHYEKIYDFTSTATTNELDSLIRANW